MTKPQIQRVCAREILDSRGNPTVESTVILTDGAVGVASVPSGASTGIYEAKEKRDGDEKRYGGKGVTQAVYNVCRVISPAIAGICATEQAEIDRTMIELDGTPDKSDLGANAILSVSLAAARAAANSYHMPVFRYLGGADAYRMPVPMMNILNGGAHASNNVEIQEFMIVPVGAENFEEAVRIGSEIYHKLGKNLAMRGLETAVGDEGGFAPSLNNDEEALDFILDAIHDAGYDETRVKLALDVAASEWCHDGAYKTPKRKLEYDAHHLADYLSSLCAKYPIMSVEDGLDQRDYDGWKYLTEKLGERVMLVGDDLFVTNTERLKKGISLGIGNSILIKPNQIGTLTETLNVIHMAGESGYKHILSHRSGETEDTTIADIAVATSAPFIKSGAPCRSERVAKYNRLLRIESSFSSGSCFGGISSEMKNKDIPAFSAILE